MNFIICAEYENYLLGNSDGYKVVQSNMNTGDINNRVISLLKYVFEDLLEWTPYMIRDYISWDLIHWLKLDSAIKKVEFPVELDKDKDLFYIAHILYPDLISYRKRDYTLALYCKVMNKEKRKFPKNFFSDKNGQDNLKICFSYCVQQNLFDLSLKEQYMYFSNVTKSNNFLKKTGLRVAYYQFYTTVLDLFHDSLGENGNELYYQYARYILGLNQTKGN